MDGWTDGWMDGRIETSTIRSHAQLCGLRHALPTTEVGAGHNRGRRRRRRMPGVSVVSSRQLVVVVVPDEMLLDQWEVHVRHAPSKAPVLFGQPEKVSGNHGNQWNTVWTRVKTDRIAGKRQTNLYSTMRILSIPQSSQSGRS